MRLRRLTLVFIFVAVLDPARVEAREAAEVVHQGRDATPGISAVAGIYLAGERASGTRADDRAGASSFSEPDYSPEALVDIEDRQTFAATDAVAVIDPEPCLRRKFGGTWGDSLSFCVPAPDRKGKPGKGKQQPSVAPEEVARILTDRAVALAPDPRIEVAPERIGVTGLESYFWLDRPDPIVASAGVGGLVVTAEARPVQWVWGFGDGEDTVTSDAGRPWTLRQPGNIAHVYEARGRYGLSVEQIWEARWRIGRGGWRHLGYFSDSAGRTYRVRPIIPVLVPSE
jgi:hypothetical protein